MSGKDEAPTEKDLGAIIPNIKTQEQLEQELFPPGATKNYLKQLDERKNVPAAEFFGKDTIRLDFTPEEAALIRYLESGEVGMPEIVKKASIQHLERVSMLIALKGTHVLHDMMVDESLEPEIRRQIAQDMINRELGLPTQKVRIEDKERIEVFSRTDAEEIRKNQQNYIELKSRTKDNIAVFQQRKDALEEGEIRKE